MNCTDCGKPIPAERLEALPETTRCVECVRQAGDPRSKGRNVFEHKTAGSAEVLTSDAFDAAARAEAEVRQRTPSRRTPPPPLDEAMDRYGASSSRRSAEAGRLPSDADCAAITFELAGHVDSGELDAFERSFVVGNLSRRAFTDLQKIECRKLAKKFDLKAWRP